MKLNTTPENIAVLGNVSNVGEFRIKNSAKAFSILSSGLYANKIRAIIRELSCNAYDSHVAAGKKDVPFDLHLPTVYEPYFSIRDFGTGLTHDQVINIYTTYFESTKTDSNDFIGALGLGSKSPFSYTDNFTVTAIKDGVQNIYTAFINEMGVPSVALMTSTKTTDSNGVEVKFAVDIKSDYTKFKNETKEVFKYFPVNPNMTGAECSIIPVEYTEKDVIPGIHVIRGNSNDCIAVMGNIPYPIDIPNSDINLGPLASLINKSLEIHFEIGDLEFQASREGLSYTPDTIDAIKKKLQLLQDKLDGILFKEADSYTNLWERAEFLFKKNNIGLWKNSVTNYVSNNPVKQLLDLGYRHWYGVTYKSVYFSDDDLEKKYNIKINSFVSPDRSDDNFSNGRKSRIYSNKTNKNEEKWEISFINKNFFVKYDKFRGGVQHCKHHFKEMLNDLNTHSKYKYKNVWILSPAKSDKQVDYDGFFNEILNPPKSMIIEMDELVEKPKVQKRKSDYVVTALYLKHDTNPRNSNSYVWETAGDISTYDATKTYYYIPLSGFNPIEKPGYSLGNIKSVLTTIRSCGIKQLHEIGTIYGIRKTDIAVVEELPNWINIQDHIINTLNSLNISDLINAYARNKMHSNVFNSKDNIAKNIKNPDSFYLKFINMCEKTQSMNPSYLKELYEVYNDVSNFNKITAEMDKLIHTFRNKYPLVEYIAYNAKYNDVAHYINMIDNQPTT